MKTKIIVSGGYANEINSDNTKFFTEIVRDTPDKLSVLIILFAKPEDEWAKKSQYVINQFERVGGLKNIKYTVATHNNLENQLGKSDVVYIHGGNTALLIKSMQKHPDFVEKIKSKIVAGESAGTYLLSKCFYSKSLQQIRDGLGVIPIKVICHFEDRNENKLDDCPDNLEKLLLKDFEHKVYFV
ncbi:MAG: Type 1 glutamine amidotransferase-like domain-containing protein [Patescibacteria group bacterium]